MEKVGHRNTVFLTHHIYPDDLIGKIAEAAADLVADGSTTDDFLRFFGRCFVRYFSHYGYEKFIKVITYYYRVAVLDVGKSNHCSSSDSRLFLIVILSYIVIRFPYILRFTGE